MAAAPEKSGLEIVGSVFDVHGGEVPAKAVDFLREAGDGVVVILRVRGALSDGTREPRLQQLERALGTAVERPQRIEGLIEAMASALEPPTPATVLQARRNVEARLVLLEEFGALTGPEVADLVGSRAENRSAIAARWRKEGRLLSVTHNDTVYFPGFQFGEDGRPLPVVADVLASLRREPMSEWETALWFTSSNGWLADRRPVDLLQTEPEAVVGAAEREVAEIAG